MIPGMELAGRPVVLIHGRQRPPRMRPSHYPIQLQTSDRGGYRTSRSVWEEFIVSFHFATLARDHPGSGCSGKVRDS